MSFMAYFQADGELRFSITPRPVPMRHRAEFEVERFKARMTHPEVGVWFCWIDEVEEPDVYGEYQESGGRTARQS